MLKNWQHALMTDRNCFRMGVALLVAILSVAAMMPVHH